MNQQQIKQLEKELWDAADALRSNSKLTAAEYKDPVLGLVLLRFAQNKFDEAKPIVEANIPESPRGKRLATSEDFAAAGAMLLPELAQYDHLANLPESEDIADAINNAMKLIEEVNTSLLGNLPKNYQEFEPSLLRDLIRTFNKDAIKKATGDVFGRIYEYFLMKFSMQGAGAQEGGEFFTPPSLVQFIVNYIEPDHGIIHDPACGSGGMFVQTGYFVKSHTNAEVNEAIKVYGTEQKSNNTKLAKINLAIHGIEGKIEEANSFFADPHDLFEKCDFVMANPPFNVKKIDMSKEYIKNDRRLPWKTPKADNGNYLWVQYFHSYLKPKKGRAGFVMASSTTDAGHSEGEIRAKLVETQDVDCIVSVGNNFFYTRSLPCHLWFLDKGKRPENADKVLMIDARNVFRKVTTTVNDFSFGHLVNLDTIKHLYHGKTDAVPYAITQHQAFLMEQFEVVFEHYKTFSESLKTITQDEKIVDFLTEIQKPIDVQSTDNQIDKLLKPSEKAMALVENWQSELADITDKKLAKTLRETIAKLNRANTVFTESTKEFLDYAKQGIKDWQCLLEWFSDNQYRDIEGLCKVVDLDEIRANDYSLTPGRYVGVSISTDEDFDYKTRLAEINTEFTTLNIEAVGLAQMIENNNKMLLK
jgi:type I restriction enzyme M protein